MRTLHEFLEEHSFRYMKEFTIDGEVVEMYLHPESKRPILVHLFDAPTPKNADQEYERSFELYVPATGSNKITDTLDATINHLNDL